MDKFSIMKAFLVHTPVKVGAKYILPSFYNFSSGSVQMPVKESLAAAPGKSFSDMFKDDLYVLYSRGLNSSATIAKALG